MIIDNLYRRGPEIFACGVADTRGKDSTFIAPLYLLYVFVSTIPSPKVGNMGFFTLDAAASGPTKGIQSNAKGLLISGVFAFAAFQYGYLHR